ncbi:MAG: gliding motility-associated C-terminal domain-containing protein [Saprospiraceae bacterium]|nr:gliding motility-associated C-terminal domain-containing protein [Saprospiraceae bacterium]MBK9632207.1 gliding motility-associated C-terminal domain-containing protein [Saprospiraceae bacterium]
MSLPKIKSLKFKFIHSFQNERWNLLVSEMRLIMVFSGLLFLTSPLVASIDTLPPAVRYGEPCPTGREADVWYLGGSSSPTKSWDMGTAIYWDQGIPRIDSGFMGYSAETMASICDKEGKLIFYANADLVFDTSHVRLKNWVDLNGGLGGNLLFLPQPGNDSIYYLMVPELTPNITGRVFSPPPRLFYYIINRKGNGGRGEIILPQYRVLIDSVAGRITAARHCNGSDWWLVSRNALTEVIYVWKLDSSGLHTSPHQIYDPGFRSWNKKYRLTEPILFNHSGSLMAAYNYDVATIPYDDVLSLHRFDPATGLFYHSIRAPFRSKLDLYIELQSMEFSPDDRFLYMTGYDFFQFDLLELDSVKIVTSVIEHPEFFYRGGLLLGPDGQIYRSNAYDPYYDIIREPNRKYPACNLDIRAMYSYNYLDDRMPEFASGLRWPYKAYIRGQNESCADTLLKYYLVDPCPHAKAEWSMPDGGELRSHYGDTVEIYFQKAGEYRLTARYPTGCGYKSDTMRIYINPCQCIMPFVWIKKDSIVCAGQDAVLAWQAIGSEVSIAGQILNVDSFRLINLSKDTLVEIRFSYPRFCDTVVLVPIKVASQFTEELMFRLCPGDSVQIEGNFYHKDTLLSFTNQTSQGCDSILNYRILLGETDTIKLAHRLCRGDSLFINGEVYKDSGRLEQRLFSSRGCEDSLVIHEILIVEASAKIHEQIKLCTGDSVRIAGKWYKNDTVIQISYLNAQGCDSLREWNINLIPTIPIQLDTLYFCLGDSLLIDGQYHYASKDIDLYYNTHQGCDSIVVISLIQYPADPPLLDQHLICYGDSILIAGNYVSKDTIFDKNYIDKNGCDSTIQHRIIILPEIPVVKISHSICPGDSIFIDGSFYYDSIWIQKHFTSQITGCDSFVNYRINLMDAPEPVYTELLSCPGDTVFLEGRNFISDVSLNLRKASPTGCDSLFHYNIRFHPDQDAGLPDVLEVEEGQSVKVTPWIAPNIKSIRWYPVQGLSCTTCSEPTISVSIETLYYLETTDEFGCIHLDSVLIQLKKIESQIHIPNAFSPNGDNINDFWLPVGSHKSVQFHNIEVYDRWGGQIFNWVPNATGDLPIGWDGRFKGHPMIPGVYVYRIRYSSSSNPIVEISGELTLVR